MIENDRAVLVVFCNQRLAGRPGEAKYYFKIICPFPGAWDINHALSFSHAPVRANICGLVVISNARRRQATVENDDFQPIGPAPYVWITPTVSCKGTLGAYAKSYSGYLGFSLKAQYAETFKRTVVNMLV